MDIIWKFVAIGIIISIIISTVFGIYSKSTASPYTRTLFGVSSSDLIFGLMVLVIVSTFFVLSVVSCLIRDLTFPTNNPVEFTIETLVVGIIPSLIILLMTILRGYTITNVTAGEFMILVVKFSVLHILLQFSGFYSSLFPPK